MALSQREALCNSSYLGDLKGGVTPFFNNLLDGIEIQVQGGVVEPLSGIEKLIDEPGFGVLLKERVALAKERYVSLEHAAGVLEAENLSLKLENFRLKEKISNLERQLAQRSL